jgi:hypothetical protein
VWLGSWGYSRTTSHGAPIMPQCRLTVLSLTWCRTTSRLALATPQADFGASCATSAAGSAEQDVLAVAGSLLTPHWRVRRSSQHLRALRFSSPHPTSIPPHAHAHARKTFLNGSRRPAVNLNYTQCQLHRLVFSSRIPIQLPSRCFHLVARRETTPAD